MTFKFPIPLPFILLWASTALPVIIILGFQTRQLFDLKTELQLLGNQVTTLSLAPAKPAVEEVATPSATPKSNTRGMVPVSQGESKK